MSRKERTVFVALIVNVLVIVFKFWLAGASGSLSLQASAVHSISDAAVGVFVLLGLLLARWGTTRSQGKAWFSQIENWLAVGVALAIFYIGFDIIREVLTGETPDLRNTGPVALASLITIPIAWFLARYEQYVGKQTNSLVLIAGGYHARMDIFTSIVAVAGLAGASLGLPALDRTAAVIVVVFIFFAGFEILASAWRALTQHTALDMGEAHTHDSIPVIGRRWRVFLPMAAIALVGLYLLSGFYTVQPGEVAVVRRFGNVVDGAVGPGLHYRLPWPIDRIDMVATDQLRRVETPASLMITGDENLISVRLSLQYSVKDPAAFLLNAASPDVLAQQASATALRQIVAQEGVDALLTVDKAAIQKRAAALTQEILDAYKSGLAVAGMQVLESNPPPEVADAFRDVSSAREDRNTFINEAQAYMNEVLPVARGDAAVAIQSANVYSIDKLAKANGDAALFSNQQAAYAKAPEVTRIRLYLEAAEKVLIGARKFILDPIIRLQTTDLWVSGSGKPQQFPPQP